MFAPVHDHPALRFAALCHGGPDDAPVRMTGPRMAIPLRRDPRDRRLTDTPWN